MNHWKQFKPKACSVRLKAPTKEQALVEVVANLVQAEILRRLRASGDDCLQDAFVVTVNGIAAGMRNTG